MPTLEIQINKKFGKYYASQIIEVACDEERTPLDQFWRRRLKDAQIDGYCEILPAKNLHTSLPKKTKTTRRKGIKKDKGGF